MTTDTRTREPRIRAGHWNAHGQPDAFNYLARQAPRLDFIGINEGRRVVPVMRAAPGRRLVVAEGHDMPRGALDCPISVLAKRDALGDGWAQVSERWKPAERVAPDRVVTWAAIEHPIGSVAYVNAHLNAGGDALNGTDPDHPIAREYAESVRSVDRLLTYLRGEFDYVLFGADVNMRDGVDRPWSPYPMLRRHGFDVFSVGLDVLAWSKGLELVKPVRVIPKEVGRTDHPGLVGSWRARSA